MIRMPLGRIRLKERGSNQVGLVAHALAYEWGLGYAPDALQQVRETRSQVGLTISQRRENVSNAYHAKQSVGKMKSILLMEDVERLALRFQLVLLHGFQLARRISMC